MNLKNLIKENKLRKYIFELKLKWLFVRVSTTATSFFIKLFICFCKIYMYACPYLLLAMGAVTLSLSACIW